MGKSHEIAQGEEGEQGASFDAHAIRIGIAPSSQSSPRQDVGSSKPFLFKRCVARARLPKVTLFVVFILRPRQTDSHGLPSDGWVKVLRGRRPPSVQWPPAKNGPTKTDPEIRTSYRGIRTKSEVSKPHCQHWARKRRREGANSRSVAACQGGQPACAIQISSRQRQSPRWSDSSELWTRWKTSVDQRSKRSSKARERPIVELVKECKDSSSAPPNVSTS